MAFIRDLARRSDRSRHYLRASGSGSKDSGGKTGAGTSEIDTEE